MESILERLIWDTPVYDELAAEYREAKAAGVTDFHPHWRLEAQWKIDAEREMWEHGAPF